jgi:hypothetical protein
VAGSRAKTVGGVGAAAALLLVASAASASPTARLVYSRAPDALSCPDEAVLRKAVSARVGYDAFFPWAPRTLVAAIVRREGAFVATVDLVDEAGVDHGAHELHTEGACAALLDAVALAAAIAIDPRTALIVAPPPVAPVSPPPEPPAAPPFPPPPTASPPAAAPRAPPEPRRRVAFEASLGAVGTFEMGPGPAVGAVVGVAMRSSRFSLGLEGLIDSPSSRAASDGSRASAWLTFGALVPCVSLGPAFACAVGQVGSLQSAGEAAGTHTATNPWFALGGRVGALIPITGTLSLRPHLDVVGDLEPTTLKVGVPTAWTASPVAGALGIDAVMRFR